MKYETKNNIGMGLAMVGSLSVIVSLMAFDFGGWVFWVAMALSIIMAGCGFFMMTRDFGELDKDHPDYERWQERREANRREWEDRQKLK